LRFGLRTLIFSGNIHHTCFFEWKPRQEKWTIDEVFQVKMNFFLKIQAYFNFYLTGLKKKNSSVKSAVFLFTGSAFNILLQIFTAPVLSRIYTPEAYGMFGIFNALIVNIGAFSTLMLPFAFVISDKKQFRDLLGISILFSTFYSLVLLILFFGFNGPVNRLLENSLGYILLLIPAAILLASYSGILLYWNIKNKYFTRNSISDVSANISIKGTSILFGVFSKGAFWGLLVSDLLGKLMLIFFLLTRRKLKYIWLVLKNFNLKNAIGTVKTYRNYPLYILPSEYLNLISTQFPTYFLTIFYSNFFLGSFVFAVTLLNIPFGVLNSAIRPVFIQKVTETVKIDLALVGPMVHKIFYSLFIAGLLPIVFLTWYGGLIFSFVFGEKWMLAGIFTGYLGYAYIMKILVAPLTAVFYPLKKEKVLSKFFIVNSALQFVVLFTIGYLKYSAETFIISFALIEIIMNLVMLVIILRLVKLPFMKYLINITLAVLVINLLFFLVNRFFGL
jgi:O-antigen/teichoic acid export membrane protein